MKNLVRGGIILLMLGVFVVFIYAQTMTEETTEDAKVSKIQFNNLEADLIETDIIDNTNIGQKNDPKDQKKENKEQRAVGQDKKEEVKEDEEKTSNPQVKKTGSSRARAVSKGRFVATAYCLRGRTASGHNVAKGIIAADPRVLPLGTRVVLGAGNYSGDYVVRDTGGKIKGNKIDIWMASCAEAIRFGRRSVDLSVLMN